MSLPRLEETRCNLCGASDAGFLFPVTDPVSGESFRVVRCRSCSLAYVNPRPTREDIGAYYPRESYYAYRFTDQATLRKRVRNYVLELQGGYPHLERDAVAVRLLGRALATLFRGQVLTLVPFLAGGRALDVGCGCGEHLLWLKRHGWEVRGVEISPEAARLANEQGLAVFCGELSGAGYPDDYFDHVSLVHVLEHTHDPVQTLREVHRVLKPGGRLLLGVPNFASWENGLFGENQSILLEVPRHLYHFSRPTLTRMLREAGFSVERVAGKTFFIPRVNRKSLELVRKNGSARSFLGTLFAFCLARPLRYALSPDREAFGQLFTFYAVKEGGAPAPAGPHR